MKIERLLATLIAVVILTIPVQAQATTITVLSDDDPGEGFEDTTPVNPVGGNTGQTLGQQRMNVAQAAADQWAGLVNSSVEIKISGAWEELDCESNSGVLGSAGPTQVARDFPGAEPDTWYHIALARAIAGPGSSLDTGEPDISMTLNMKLDEGDDDCLLGNTWYYGLDGSGPAGTIDLYPVILHELAHGLGFSNFVNLEEGSLFNDLTDVYINNLRDTQIGQDWPDMTDNQRANSATNDPNVVWTGPAVTGSADQYVFNTGAFSQGFLRIHAPDDLASGSSISHWTADASPDLLMKPVLGNIDFTQVDLTPALMQDIGWETALFRDRFEAN